MMDFFANIAAKGVGGKAELLSENAPRQHKKSMCGWNYDQMPCMKHVLLVGCDD